MSLGKVMLPLVLISTVSVWKSNCILNCYRFIINILIFEGDEAPTPKDGIKPTFTERPVIRQSDDCTTVTFECRLVGEPTPTVAWYKSKFSSNNSVQHHINARASFDSGSTETNRWEKEVDTKCLCKKTPNCIRLCDLL
jgi:hypothetical protein